MDTISNVYIYIYIYIYIYKQPPRSGGFVCPTPPPWDTQGHLYGYMRLYMVICYVKCVFGMSGLVFWVFGFVFWVSGLVFGCLDLYSGYCILAGCRYTCRVSV